LIGTSKKKAYQEHNGSNQRFWKNWANKKTTASPASANQESDCLYLYHGVGRCKSILHLPSPEIKKDVVR
jgi:hypothetical protein